MVIDDCTLLDDGGYSQSLAGADGALPDSSIQVVISWMLRWASSWLPVLCTRQRARDEIARTLVLKQLTWASTSFAAFEL